jgi:branched-chain amino acid transport system substrate-binding protein
MASLCWALLAAHPTGATAAANAANVLPERTVLIGVSVALSGISAPIAENIVNAAQLAVQAANRRKTVIAGQPVRFELLVQDDRDDSNRARIAARYLNVAGVVGVIGNLSTGASLAASAIYDNAGIAHISPASNGRAFTQEGFRTAFRMPGHDAAGCALLGQYTVHTLHLANIAIISNGTTFGDSLAQYCGAAIRNSGGTVVSTDTVDSRTSDFNAALSHAQQADLIFLAGFAEQAPALANAIKRLGLKAHLMTAMSGAADAAFLAATGDAANGTLALENGLPSERVPGLEALQAGYAQKFDGAMSVFGLYAYDAVGVLIAAIKQADSLERARIVESLHRIRYKGVSGPVAFNAEGDIENPTFTLYEVRKRQWVPLKLFGERR